MEQIQLWKSRIESCFRSGRSPGGRCLGAAVSLTGGAPENARDFAAPLRLLRSSRRQPARGGPAPAARGLAAMCGFETGDLEQSVVYIPHTGRI